MPRLWVPSGTMTKVVRVDVDGPKEEPGAWVDEGCGFPLAFGPELEFDVFDGMEPPEPWHPVRIMPAMRAAMTRCFTMMCLP